MHSESSRAGVEHSLHDCRGFQKMPASTTFEARSFVDYFERQTIVQNATSVCAATSLNHFRQLRLHPRLHKVTSARLRRSWQAQERQSKRSHLPSSSCLALQQPSFKATTGTGRCAAHSVLPRIPHIRRTTLKNSENKVNS